MNFTKIIDTTPPQMELIAYNCSADAFAFEELHTEPIYRNSSILEMSWQDAKSSSYAAWKDELDNAYDSFFDGFVNNDVFRSADGRFWAVEQIWIDALGGLAPLYWREVKKSAANP